MYNEYNDFNEINEYRETMGNSFGQAAGGEYASGGSRKHRRNHRKNGILRKATALVMSAALFGGVAGGTFCAVTGILGGSEDTEAAATAQNSSASVASVSYTSDSDTSGQSLDVSDIAAAGLTSVVSVTNISVQEVENYFGMFGRNGGGGIQTEETTSCGSGVIIYSDDEYLYMVTNYHVVEDATTLSVTFVDDATYEAELCGYDDSVDIAVIKVSTSELSSDTLSQISVVTIGNSDDLVVGEQVVAIGNALGYGQSVTTGIVSAVDRTISEETDDDDTYDEYTDRYSLYGDEMYGGSFYNEYAYGDESAYEAASETAVTTYIQTDAAINPGNSGGALLNMDGELIGINTAKVSSTDVEGMGYAIPISQVLELIEGMIAG